MEVVLDLIGFVRWLLGLSLPLLAAGAIFVALAPRLPRRRRLRTYLERLLLVASGLFVWESAGQQRLRWLQTGCMEVMLQPEDPSPLVLELFLVHERCFEPSDLQRGDDADVPFLRPLMSRSALDRTGALLAEASVAEPSDQRIREGALKAVVTSPDLLRQLVVFRTGRSACRFLGDLERTLASESVATRCTAILWREWFARSKADTTLPGCNTPRALDVCAEGPVGDWIEDGPLAAQQKQRGEHEDELLDDEAVPFPFD